MKRVSCLFLPLACLIMLCSCWKKSGGTAPATDPTPRRFELISEKSGKAYGPFDLEDGAEVQLDKFSFTLKQADDSGFENDTTTNLDSPEALQLKQALLGTWVTDSDALVATAIEKGHNPEFAGKWDYQKFRTFTGDKIIVNLDANQMELDYEVTAIDGNTLTLAQSWSHWQRPQTEAFTVISDEQLLIEKYNLPLRRITSQERALLDQLQKPDSVVAAVDGGEKLFDLNTAYQIRSGSNLLRFSNGTEVILLSTEAPNFSWGTYDERSQYRVVARYTSGDKTFSAVNKDKPGVLLTARGRVSFTITEISQARVSGHFRFTGIRGNKESDITVRGAFKNVRRKQRK
jgi:hypothetical protein